MGIFRFKRFSVANEDSAQKVGTDGVLLGATALLPECSLPIRVLDVGTGTGLVALMLAQRLSDAGKSFEITGIDVDLPSAREAALNFLSSPWASSMKSLHLPFSQLSSEGVWDLIVSNPPYYDLSLQAPDSRRNVARHVSTLSFRELCAFAPEHISPQGVLALVLPADQERELVRCATSYGLNLCDMLRIQPTPTKLPSRIVACFSKERRCASESSLILMEKGRRTDEYASLTRDFYL